MNSSSKNMLGALIIAGSLFLFWMLDVATYSQIPQYKQVLEERHKTLEERQTVLNNIEEMYKEYQQKSVGVRLLSSAVPTKKDLADLIVSLDSIALQSGVSLRDVSLAESTGSGAANQTIAQVGLEMTIEGTYNGLLLFLSNLEQNIRIIDITNLNVQTYAGGIIKVGMSARTYFLK